MDIGLLKDRKKHETRVALMPGQVSGLREKGHTVLVETGAGKAAGFPDEAYRSQGAEVVAREAVYRRARLLVRVKCPGPEEAAFHRPDHILFAFLHFDENIAPEKITRLIDTGMTALAFEWVEHEGDQVLLRPMSELTGDLFAARSMELLVHHAGRLAGFPQNSDSPRAMVIGAGRIGARATARFLRNGVPTVVVDKHPETVETRLQQALPPPLLAMLRAHLTILPFEQLRPKDSVATIRAELDRIHILICAAVRRDDLPKRACPFLVDREGILRMPRQAVICDATACENDFIEGSYSTESLYEIAEKDNRIFYSPDHIPALVPHTATESLARALFPYLCRLAENPEKSLGHDKELRAAVMCCGGHLTHRHSAERKNMPFRPLDEVLAGRTEKENP